MAATSKRQVGASHFLARLVNNDLTYGREVIRSFLNSISPFDRVVDIGAGLGADLSIAKEICPAAHLIGLECDRNYRSALQEKGYHCLGLNIERDMFPFDPESVDVFVANQVLEHTKEIFWIFHEVTRCLKRGGHFVIGIPNLASLHNRFLMLLGRQPTQLKSYSAHVRGFTKLDLIRFLEEAFPGGYSLEAFCGSQFYPFPGFMAKRLATWFPSMAFSIFFLLKKCRPYEDGFILYPVERELETPFWTGK